MPDLKAAIAAAQARVTDGSGRPPVGRWLLPAVGLTAFMVRIAPILANGSLRGVRGYDDGVYLAVAQRLIAGIVPYRDDVFLHPPGVAVALAPFAALANSWGDTWSLALARVAFMVIGALNAMLIARILARRGVLAAVVGGGAYALWGATIATEQTMFLEPPIGLGLLIALGALARSSPGSTGRRRPVASALAIAGLALGVAVTFKIWVVLDVAVLGAVVLSRSGGRATARWLMWCVLGAAPIVLPFLVLAPGRFWSDVVVVQAGRPLQTKGIADRLGAAHLASMLHTSASGLLAAAIAALLLAAVLGPLLVALRSGKRPAQWGDPVWWGVLAAVQLGALAVAPSYYTHYSSFVAPALCLLLGAGVGHLAATLRARGGRWGRVGVGVVVVASTAAGLGLIWTRPPLPRTGPVDHSVLVEFAAAHECLWARNPSYLQVADATARQLRGRCPASLDLVGTWLVLAGGGTVPGSTAKDLDGLILTQLAGSDGALLYARDPTQGLGPRSTAYLRSQFTARRTTGQIQMWTRTG